MGTWTGLAVSWLFLSTVGGGIVGLAGTAVAGPGVGAVLAGVTAGLALVYALDAVVVARRSGPSAGRPG